MVRRYAHFAANHLTEYARQIGSILQKMSQICPTKEYQRLEKVDYCLILNGTLQDSNTDHISIVITPFFSIRKTPGPPIRPPNAFR